MINRLSTILPFLLAMDLIILSFALSLQWDFLYCL